VKEEQGWAKFSFSSTFKVEFIAGWAGSQEEKAG
jgi:hypothetical protein